MALYAIAVSCVAVSMIDSCPAGRASHVSVTEWVYAPKD